MEEKSTVMNKIKDLSNQNLVIQPGRGNVLTGLL